MHVESKPSAPHPCLSAPADPTRHRHGLTPSAVLPTQTEGLPKNAEQGGPRGWQTVPILASLRTESTCARRPQNLPVRTAAGGGYQEPTPHSVYSLCKHLTGKKPEGMQVVAASWAACSRSQVTPGAWRSPASGQGQPGLWLQREAMSGCCIFFLKQLCLEKIGRDCCGSSISPKTFGLRNCNANCIAKIFPGLGSKVG